MIPLGGMDSVQRLETMREYGATALLCTPSYALHLAKVAAEHELLEARSPAVERVVCTGEPGASMPAVRERIETAWGARCLDHAGASEVGSLAYPCADARRAAPVRGRVRLRGARSRDRRARARGRDRRARHDRARAGTGFPVIRYRTGDMVERTSEPCPAGHPGMWLPQGILGRVDDMVVIRGMNVFPSAIEEILRRSGGVGEFSITFYNDPHAMDEVKVEVELAQRARGARHPGAAAPDARAARPDRAGQAGDPADLQRQGAARARPAPGGPGARRDGGGEAWRPGEPALRRSASEEVADAIRAYMFTPRRCSPATGWGGRRTWRGASA